MAEPKYAAPDSPIPRFLRLVTCIECGVVLAAAVLLFFSPPLGKEIWAWGVTPYNSRYMGAIYFAALLPLAVFAWSGRWSPGRVVLWMIFAFTTTVMAAMLLNADRFDWSRPAAGVFWFLYLFLPLNSAFFLVRLRSLPVATRESPGPAQKPALLAILAALAAYGAVLAVAPQIATAFWPWPVDAFHGRMYAATFIAPAVAAAVLLRGGSAAEFRCVGATLILLGVLSVAAIAWTSTVVPPPKKVDYAQAGTQVFIALNLFAAIAGSWLACRAGRR